MPPEVIVFIGIAVLAIGVGGLFFVGSAIAIAVQARWRGYSLSLWLFAGLAVFNPVIFLVMLALMPNLARKRLRDEFREKLDAKLAGRPVDAAAEFGSATPPSLAGSTLPERSLGDLPTMAPPERLLGDEATRG